MKLFDATLDLAQFARGTEDYEISAVRNGQIICNGLSGRVAEFGGGTIWFQTGDSAGQFGKIKSSRAQVIDLQDSFPDGYAAGDVITIGAWLEFDTQKLINAVNSVLRTYKIMAGNHDLKYDPCRVSYELPDEVTDDIRRVELPMNIPVTVPDEETGEGSEEEAEDHAAELILHYAHYVESHFWKSEDRHLTLYDRHKRAYLENGPIRIYYAKMHGAVGKTDEISAQVDPLYLRYMAWLYLCRNLLQETHKDNLIASDMYNEAKVYERDYSKLPNKHLHRKTWTFPQW